jgi:hypothetical protein
MVSEKWKACAGVRLVHAVLKGHERVGSMNVDLRGSTTPKNPG